MVGKCTICMHKFLMLWLCVSKIALGRNDDMPKIYSSVRMFFTSFLFPYYASARFSVILGGGKNVVFIRKPETKERNPLKYFPVQHTRTINFKVKYVYSFCFIFKSYSNIRRFRLYIYMVCLPIPFTVKLKLKHNIKRNNIVKLTKVQNIHMSILLSRPQVIHAAFIPYCGQIMK